MRPDMAGPFAGGSRYNAYSAFLRERFGCRVYKVSVDAGFTCPNRDGTVGWGGCIYCNNDSFRAASAVLKESVPEQVSRGVEYLKQRFRASKFIVYFQPFSNTYAPLEVLVPLYESALAHTDVIGISIGTRPDCVDDGKIRWFEQLARNRYVVIEYGLESACDKTLARINRGHNFHCWQDAVSRTRNRGIWIGAHLILGFPWESREETADMADIVSASGIHFLKLHHLHIVKQTVLAHEYAKQPFRLPAYEEYLDLVVDFLERLNPVICLERLFGLSPREHLVAPLWEKSKAEMQRDIEQRLTARNTFQGRLYRFSPVPST